MTNEEFSNEFDVLYNSITSNQAPGLDEYEKSVFLTKAQSEILREYFNSRVDGTNGGFDGSQKRQYDFSQLIRTIELNQDIDEDNFGFALDSRSVRFLFPDDYFLSINEVIEDESYVYSVLPISYTDYQRLLSKPYPYPPKNYVWRLFTSYYTPESEETGELPGVVAEILGKFRDEGENLHYKLRYIKRPNPIILRDFTSDKLSIDGVSIETPCELPAQLHQEILERAVTLAKIAYQGGSTATIAAQSNKNNQQQ